ncbi:hypothetical protein Psi02_70330 [Planotetraspora silvatica]|uniref:Uncharacterized protein n=1 Tax=Planotetraspora silvatica TaxID=234614 RepID=A0A8J3UY79_9ACTN|nr:hypothetical protein Psi02_70330 [Planotetraspora silvatica]
MEAWRLIIGGEVTPTAMVPTLDGIDQWDEVEAVWDSVARDSGIFGGRNEFLISVAGPGAADAPWAHVRRDSRPKLAHHSFSPVGEPEFVTTSLDGRCVCGVTTEEYAVWVVARSFE